jgi:uncharacterized protein
MKKILLICAGSMCLALGIIGVVVPVLPTTPFLLLAAYCYLRSSTKMYEWLMNHKILGAYIYSYLKYNAIPTKTRNVALLFLWSTLILSMIVVSSPHVSIFLCIIGLCVTIHLFTLKTISAEEMKTISLAIEGNDET